ncbi:MAG: Rpn family recombination-promoting nuclease/putative transposase [Clostridium sp.]|nr:Rpn family recombination-promoting nuclease/putative transposase [Clostridium sp.]
MQNEQMNRAFEELTLKDDFMFGVIMRQPEYCKPCLERILGIKIRHIKVPESQKVLDVSADAKSVRLDIYVEDDRDTVYNIEMQTVKRKFLPKRSRYYQDLMDINQLEKGSHYSQLKKSYIIFICTFDYYGEGRYFYTFENRCRENPRLAFGDETVKLVLNTKGTEGEVSQELLDFLRYIETGIPTDDYTQELENEVNRVRRNEKWRLDYMTLYLKQQESYMDGKEEGISRGMEQKSLEIAKALLDVLDMPTVAVKTGLPVEVVQELKADSPDEGKR